jgi:hypothetical protein
MLDKLALLRELVTEVLRRPAAAQLQNLADLSHFRS